MGLMIYNTDIEHTIREHKYEKLSSWPLKRGENGFESSSPQQSEILIGYSKHRDNVTLLSACPIPYAL